MITVSPFIRGFKAVETPVLILDESGREFYDTSKIKNFSGVFNIPKNTPLNLVSGKIIEIPQVKFPLKKLPIRERFNYPNPRYFEFMFGENPNKCSVIWDYKKIIADTSFFGGLTIPERFFILFHEYGHQFYHTEEYCDLYAINQMLCNGFNPSQSFSSQFKTLSDNQNYRKDFIEKHI